MAPPDAAAYGEEEGDKRREQRIFNKPSSPPNSANCVNLVTGILANKKEARKKERKTNERETKDEQKGIKQTKSNKGNTKTTNGGREKEEAEKRTKLHRMFWRIRTTL